MTILTAAEVRTLAEAVERASDRLAVYVAAYTGLRAGEFWALRARDVAVAGRRLVVGRTLKEAQGKLEFVNATKTDGSRRVVSLPAFLANTIAATSRRTPMRCCSRPPAAATAALSATPPPSGTACPSAASSSPPSAPSCQRRSRMSAGTNSATPARRS